MNDQQIIKEGVFEMNLTFPEFKKNGERIYFTKREWDFARVFMFHPHKVLARRYIENIIYNQDMIGDRAIDVYVGYLKKKIGFNHIKTVRNFGYEFIPE